MECPVCKCKNFYVKDPEDDYEIEEFECDGDNVKFQTDPHQELESDTEVYCDRCSWHGAFDKLNK